MAAIAAIIVPSVLLEPGSSFIGLSHPKSIAVLASLIGWFLTRQMVVSMAGGVSFYLAAKFLI
jgi:branched-subunit amino acid transport protein